MTNNSVAYLGVSYSRGLAVYCTIHMYQYLFCHSACLISFQAYIIRQHEDDKLIAFERAGLLFVFNFHTSKSFSDYKIGVKEPGQYPLLHEHIAGASIPAWISNYIHYKVCDEITYPYPNFNGATIEVWEWISNFITHFIGHMITYLCWD